MSKFFIGTLMFFNLMFFITSGQPDFRIDSLVNVIKKEKKDTNTVRAYLLLYNALRLSNADSALKVSQKAFKLSQELDFQYGMACGYSNIGDYYNGKGNYSKALDNALKAITIFEKIGYKKKQAITCNSIGNTYLGLGNDTKAFEYFELTYTIAKQIPDEHLIAIANMGKGAVYNHQNRYADYLKCLYESQSIFAKEKSPYPLGIVTGNIAEAYVKLRQKDSASYYIEKSLAINKSLENTYAIYCIYQIKGDLAFEFDEYAEALDNYLISAKMCEKEGDQDNLKNIFKSIADVYVKTKNYEKAYEFHAKYTALKDTVFNTDSRNKLVEMQTKFDSEKKEQENALLQKENELASKKISEQRIMSYVIISGLILVIGFSGFVLFNLKQQRRKNTIISSQKKEVERQKEMVEVQKKEVLDSIHYAKKIQDSLLFPDASFRSYFSDYFIFHQPKDIVSGDFYWCTIKGQNLYLALCDSTGHGVPGAFMSLLNMNLLNEAINEKNIDQPHDIFNYVRSRLIENMDGGQDGMDAILLKFDFNHQPPLLEYTAANNASVLVRQNEVIDFIKDKMPVGKGARDSSFTLQTMSLQKGDVIYLFTDGYADQFGGPKGKKFKYKQLEELLWQQGHLPMASQKETLALTLQQWKGMLEQVDDVLMIGIRV